MINIETDEVLPIERARLWLGERTGTAPSKVTFHRWITSGVKGVILESLLIGGRRVTSKEALQAFIAGRSGGKAVVPSARRRREIAEASKACDRIFGTRK